MAYYRLSLCFLISCIVTIESNSLFFVILVILATAASIVPGTFLSLRQLRNDQDTGSIWHRLADQQNELSRMAGEVASLRAELERVRQERDRAQEEAKQSAAKLARMEARVSELEALVSNYQALVSLDAPTRTPAVKTTKAKTRQTQLQRLQTLKDQLAVIELQIAQQGGSVDPAKIVQKETLEGQITALEHEIDA